MKATLPEEQLLMTATISGFSGRAYLSPQCLQWKQLKYLLVRDHTVLNGMTSKIHYC